MLIPSPCYFIIAALIGLFGFYHVFRACIQKSRRLILWWHIVLLMALVTAYVITISVLFVYWLRSTSHSLFLALFQLAWMGELSIQAILVQTTFWNDLVSAAITLPIPVMLLKFRMLSKLPTQRILVRTVAVIAGSLQFAGFVVSSLDDIAGIYIAFAGCCIFRVLAAVVLTVIVTYGKIRPLTLVVIALTFLCAAIGSFCLVIIRDRDTFLLANCILGCVANSSIVLHHNVPEHRSSTLTFLSAFDAGNVENPKYASLSDTSNVEKLPLSVEVTTNVNTITELNPWLPLVFCLKGFETSHILILDITTSSNNTSAQVVAFCTSNGGWLRLIKIDWDILPEDQMLKRMGDAAYADALDGFRSDRPPTPEQDYERIVWAAYGLDECITSSSERKILLDGGQVPVDALHSSFAGLT